MTRNELCERVRELIRLELEARQAARLETRPEMAYHLRKVARMFCIQAAECRRNAARMDMSEPAKLPSRLGEGV